MDLETSRAASTRSKTGSVSASATRTRAAASASANPCRAAPLLEPKPRASRRSAYTCSDTCSQLSPAQGNYLSQLLPEPLDFVAFMGPLLKCSLWGHRLAGARRSLHAGVLVASSSRQGLLVRLAAQYITVSGEHLCRACSARFMPLASGLLAAAALPGATSRWESTIAATSWAAAFSRTS